MVKMEKGIFKILGLGLIILTLFTLAQAYYSAYIHMFLFAMCYILCSKQQKVTFGFLVSGLTICFAFILMSYLKGDGAIMTHVGFFLHYMTWPIMYICVAKSYNAKEIKHLLYFIIAICIIGDILSLIQLGVNPEISRLMAGVHLEDEKAEYYRLGVGGYGYVFAMSFLTYGVVRWVKVSKSVPERIYLITFLVINSIFIIYASYTTAIILTILLFGVALLSDAKYNTQIAIIVVATILLVLFGKFFLELGYRVAKQLELGFVAKRFDQLLYAHETEDLSTLNRFELYKMSWDTFWSNPLIGGEDYGGHSQILDTFARYGILAVLLPVFFFNCKKLCDKIINKYSWLIFGLAFFAFTCVDTCSVMQLPVTVFFVVPLIIHMEQERKTEGIK